MDEKYAARTMLDDGASYEEVARTLGRCSDTIRHAWPGYKWDKRKCAEAAAMARVMARLERTAPLAIAPSSEHNNREEIAS